MQLFIPCSLCGSWAFGVLLSRSFALPTIGEGLPPPDTALLPFCDFLNHDPAATSFVTWDSDQQQVVLLPDRAYQAGQQVTSSPCSAGPALHSHGRQD